MKGWFLVTVLFFTFGSSSAYAQVGFEASPELPSSNSAGRAPATYSTGMSGSPELPANNPSGKAPADYRTGFQGSPELGAGSYQPGGNSRVDTYGESGLVTCGLSPDGRRYDCNWCSFVKMINNVVEWLIILLSVLAVLAMVYAGFIMVTSGGNTSAWERGKKILTTVIIGIIVVLAAWLIVDTVLKITTGKGINETIPSDCGGQLALSDRPNGGGAGGSGGGGAGGSGGGGSGSGSQYDSDGSGGGGSGGTGDVTQCTNENCSVEALMAAGFTEEEANVMSCIAMTESSGSAAAFNGAARGTFQIMITVNPLSGPACGGTLDCPRLCPGSGTSAIQAPSCAPCVQAAHNAACNAQSAHNLHESSGYAPWTTSSDNTRSQACVDEYGG